MQAARLAALAVAGGTLLVLVSAFAYRLGLSPSATIGWKKLLGVGVGLVAVLVGVLIRHLATPGVDEAPVLPEGEPAR